MKKFGQVAEVEDSNSDLTDPRVCNGLLIRKWKVVPRNVGRMNEWSVYVKGNGIRA